MSDDNTTSNVSEEQQEVIRQQAAELDSQRPPKPALVDQDGNLVDPPSDRELQDGHETVLRKLAAYLKHLKVDKCPSCQHDQYFVHPMLMFQGGAAPAPPVVPMPDLIPVSCQRCGTLRWFAASAIAQVPVS